MKQPLVSIVIPTYKRPELLRRAVESVLVQTYEHWEMIVSDDEPGVGESWEYLEELADRDSRVRMVKNPMIRGQATNTNNALLQARGEWIKILHDDDVLKPTCLEELVGVSNLHPNAATITCSAERYVDGVLLAPFRRKGWPLLEVIPASQVRRAMYFLENTGGAMPSQRMIHRRVVDQGILMEQPHGLQWMVDSWFNARSAACGDLVIYRRPLIEWHQGGHETETSATAESHDRELGIFRHLLWELIDDPGAVPSPDVMQKMVLLQRSFWRLNQFQFKAALAGARQVQDSRAYLQFLLWSLHNLTRGRFARGRRNVLSLAGLGIATTNGQALYPEQVPVAVADEVQLGVPRVVSEGSPRRVTVLFSRLSGYMAACLKTLRQDYGVVLQVICHPPAPDAPFDRRHFEWVDELRERTMLDDASLHEAVESFDPHAIFMSGWLDSGYLEVARSFKSRGIPVVAGSDAQYTGSLRQRLGQVVAPLYLHPAIDVLWVAGERQRQFATRLGYEGPRCWEGYYSCDWDSFGSEFEEDAERSDTFLFTGRYIERKGIDTLIEAYRMYREQVDDPWRLVCAGAGELAALLARQEGVEDRGFVQPDDLPGLMREAGAFVLPSRKEPWGVVVQEAAASGLPLICSTACGAAVHLLTEGYNGYHFTPGDAEHLARCMVRMSTLSPEDRRVMGLNSHNLSRQYTPTVWARTLMDGIDRLRKRGDVKIIPAATHLIREARGV